MDTRLPTSVLLLALVGTIGAACAAPREFVTGLTDTRSTIDARLTDETGTVRGITFVHPVPDWALQASAELTIVNDGDDVVLLRWVDGICPSAVALRLAAATGGDLRLGLDRGPRCDDDVGKIRVLEIDFDRNVPAASIDVQLVAP